MFVSKLLNRRSIFWNTHVFFEEKKKKNFRISTGFFRLSIIEHQRRTTTANSNKKVCCRSIPNKKRELKQPNSLLGEEEDWKIFLSLLLLKYVKVERATTIKFAIVVPLLLIRREFLAK
jgi:hypothetical protein